MSRDLPIGNGALLINFDHNYQLRDIYYPWVGQENHTNGDQCRFGIWVDGAFSWLDDPGFTRRLVYLPDTLVTNAGLQHENLKVTVTFNDTVDLGRDLLVRRITVANDGPEREIRLFFHYDWHIYGTEVGDTVMYYPPVKGLVAYKGQRYFAACGQVSDRIGLDSYACGKKEVGGAQGTWIDAEDGVLGNNPIEQGSVDMTLGLHLGRVPSGQIATAYHWLIAAKDLKGLEAVADVVALRTPEVFLERTRCYWIAWVNKEEREFSDLSPQVTQLFRRSLLIVRTQVDNGGAILAANDSEIIKFARDTYSYMWPRDGAMAAYAMDQAGYLDVPRRFFELCARIVTPEGYFRHKYTPAGEPGSSWHPWVDAVGRPQYPIQEDETGLVLHALWQHYDGHRDFEFFKTYYRGLIILAGGLSGEVRGSDHRPASAELRPLGRAPRRHELHGRGRVGRAAGRRQLCPAVWRDGACRQVPASGGRDEGRHPDLALRSGIEPLSPAHLRPAGRHRRQGPCHRLQRVWALLLRHAAGRRPPDREHDGSGVRPAVVQDRCRWNRPLRERLLLPGQPGHQERPGQPVVHLHHVVRAVAGCARQNTRGPGPSERAPGLGRRLGHAERCSLRSSWTPTQRCRFPCRR